MPGSSEEALTIMNKGTTLVGVDFKPGKTNDSNIIKAENSMDILNEVFNAALSID